ncbi:MAG: hypothetical protein GPOALKHO_000309 [Sodalis sp.]|nr:MAG: hypothetical protein GPOALKHO_000309 [Sodalis sp.]
MSVSSGTTYSVNNDNNNNICRKLQRPGFTSKSGNLLTFLSLLY